MASYSQFQTERNALYNKYFAYRELPIPFQTSCAITLAMQLQIQEDLELRGDFLEAGVQHGGTAFLALCAARPGEKHVLIDMERSARFEAGLAKMPAAVRQEVDFRECLTSSPALSDVEKRKFRWIHIDAGHLLEDVEHDLARFAPLLSDDGIIVMDDFFQWRWPEVTQAIHSYFIANRDKFAPLIMGFNKISFCRVDAQQRYLEEIEKRAIAYFDDIGRFLLFRKKFLGARCYSFTGGLLEKYRHGALGVEKAEGSVARLADA